MLVSCDINHMYFSPGSPTKRKCTYWKDGNHCPLVLFLLSEFFERTILCNSLVWSCALTGRAGLTYLEALESERRARQSLQSFPSALVMPLLHLVALSRRCRLTELCDDIYAFAKDRYFPGETVEVTARNGARYR